jgi:hypothetical protein
VLICDAHHTALALTYRHQPSPAGEK